jgi:type VI secretion system protein ImpK
MSQQPLPPMDQDPALVQIRRPPRRDDALPPLNDFARTAPAEMAVTPFTDAAVGGVKPTANAAPNGYAAVERDMDAPRPPPIDENLLRQQAATNPLLAAAAPILTLVCQLRGTLRHDDEPRLQWMVSEELKAFESRALLAEASPQDVIAARYVLCSLVDETVLSTPWGNQGSWASQTMLSRFHKETWGGEKVFVILDRVKGKPGRYLHLIELIGVCLALGFRGRYEVLENGLFRLDELRAEIWRAVRSQRSGAERSLSPEFKVEKVRRSLVRYVPLWVVFALAGAVTVLTYVGFNYALVQDLDGTATVLDQASPRR